MKILHLADLHKSREHFAEVEASLDVAEETAIREQVDAILLAGDLHDGAEQNSEIGLLDPFAARIQRLGDIAPVAIVYGTPTHDIPGSLDVLERLACAHGITILRPGIAYALCNGIWPLDSSLVPPKALLFGIPEPSKKWLLAREAATGKDEAAEAMRSALRSLLLGLGAKRKDHPELPCVLMYHGQVRGCKLSNGTTLPDGPVSRDDLAMVGADYIALGDIHEPQQIPGIPAYYPGSIYPTSWGETHKAGCNLVEIELDPDGVIRSDITRVDFPHPQRVKLSRTAGDAALADHYDGRMAWLEITATKAEAETLDTDEILARMIGHGALPGSKVTINVLPTETVRAGAIAEKTTLADKAMVWGENSAVPLPISVLEKARETEARIGTLGALSGPERRFRNISTRLRGSRGLYAKQKKDEILVDWQALGPGVVAYIGPNGFGKTTSIDFSKPWPIPVSRPPKTLKNHFRLRDSAIENVYLEEVSGIRYRVLINIDGATKSGSAEYYLFKDTGSGWEPYSQEACSGRLDPYTAAVEEVFGSMLIYLRTAYATQKPTKDYPDLADATKEERKALISELAGKDFSEYQAAADAEAKTLEAELVTIDAILATSADIAAVIAIEEETLQAHRAALRDASHEAEASAHRELLLKAEYEALGLRVAEIDRQEARKEQLEREIAETEKLLTTIDGEISGFQAAAGGRAAAVSELERIQAVEAQAAKLADEKAAIDKANHEALIAYQKTAEALRTRQREAQGALDARRRELADAEKAEALARAKVDPETAGKVEAARSALAQAEIATEQADTNAAQASIDLEHLRKQHSEIKALASLVDELHEGEACPLCGCADHPAPAHADAEKLATVEIEGKAALVRSTQASAALLEASKAEERARSTLQALETAALASTEAQGALGRLETETQTAREAAEAAKASLDAIQIDPAPEPAPFPGAEALASLQADLAFLDADAQREIIKRADEATVRIEEATRRKIEAQGRKETMWQERDALLTALAGAGGPRAELAAKAQELETERFAYNTATAAIASAQASAEASERSLAQARERAEKRDEAQKDRDMKALEAQEWRLLERAIIGVRDLELDALAPGIADTATRLLSGSGDTGHIEIDTTRISSGSAKKAKQIEDFLIFYVDDEGNRQDLATRSGGEMVWARKALYDAFATMRWKNAGIKWMSGFLDETDGALDPKARMDYWRMLEAAHEASGRYQTILITQSADLAAMAAQVLDVRTLEAKVAEEVAA